MPALIMSGPEECQRKFQAAVDVIHNLPKNGHYRPSYDVMLRFYGLYKQAVCGPCTVSRPGFWDPVGRYKWDAWSRLGGMSKESAMAAYVDEMKKVAQEVIDTMPMDEKTASFFHYFEPLYLVIDDMPRPPEELQRLREDVNANVQPAVQAETKDGDEDEGERKTQEVGPEQETPVTTRPTEHPGESPDSAQSDGVILTSDSESEIFCDSVEQLDSLKPVPMPCGLHNGQASPEPSDAQGEQHTAVSQVKQVGAGEGGEGAGEGRGPPVRRRDSGREDMRRGWREPSGGHHHRSSRRAGPPASGAGGGDDPEGGTGRLQDAQVQQQIVLALRRLREDMRSVRERLEVVEGLAAANAQNLDWRTEVLLTVPESEEDTWWPFDVSGRTVLLILVWPFVAQGLVFLLQRGRRKIV